MIDRGGGKYLVFEDWIEVGRFRTPDRALLLQRFRKAIRPGRQVLVFHEQGNVLSLIEHEAPGTLIKMGGGKTNMTNGKENKPVKKFQAGGISAALWENKMTLKDGRHIETLSVTLDRRYKDSDGEWKSSGSLKESDIPKAMLVLAKAYDFMTAKEPSESNDTAE